MKAPVIILPALLATAITLCAQIVNDGAANTLSNGTNSIISDVPDKAASLGLANANRFS